MSASSEKFLFHALVYYLRCCFIESRGSNPTITQGIQERYQQSAKELETLYGYYNSVTSPSETLPQKQDLSKMNDLDIAVHSLDLHLQAALLRYFEATIKNYGNLFYYSNTIWFWDFFLNVLDHDQFILVLQCLILF